MNSKNLLRLSSVYSRREQHSYISTQKIARGGSKSPFFPIKHENNIVLTKTTTKLVTNFYFCYKLVV